MSITDELREYALGWDERNRVRRDLTAIADRIDAEHERLCSRSRSNGYGDGFNDGFNDIESWVVDHEDEMAKQGWVRLPRDADEVPWSVGDRDEDGNVVTELRLTYDGCWFVITDGEWPYRPKRKRHHHDNHAPNVEDVLCDLLNEYRENECTLEEARLTEYATRLRLEDYGGR